MMRTDIPRRDPSEMPDEERLARLIVEFETHGNSSAGQWQERLPLARWLLQHVEFGDQEPSPCLTPLDPDEHCRRKPPRPVDLLDAMQDRPAIEERSRPERAARLRRPGR